MMLQRFNEAFAVKNEDTGEPMAHVRYRIEDDAGNLGQVAALDTPAFRMYPTDQDAWHPEFGRIYTAGLGEAMAGDPGSSLA